MPASAQSNLALATVSHWIGGKAVAGPLSRAGDVYNPSTGCVTARVPFASAEELDACVKVAKAAFPAWAATPPLRRARILFRFR
ncbi:MAG: aldehyde dehydrogenase family protein, partial [bacterium]